MDHELPEVVLSIAEYGFGPLLLRVRAPMQPKRFAVRGAGATPPPAGDQAARAFVEDLLGRGQVDLGVELEQADGIQYPYAQRSHELVVDGDELILRRRLFDCA